MDACNFCHCAITQNYYRVGPHMACPVCVDRERLAEVTERWQHYWRGMLFGVVAAIVGALMMWGVSEMSTFAGSSAFSLGGYIRGFAILFLGGLVGGSIRAGTKKRSMRLTQISAAVLTYLSYAMSTVPMALNHLPSTKITPIFVIVLIFVIAPIAPFLVVFKNFMAITNLICLALAMRAAWSANKLAVEVEGPFHVADTSFTAAPSFKTLEL